MEHPQCTVSLTFLSYPEIGQMFVKNLAKQIIQLINQTYSRFSPMRKAEMSL